MRLQKRLLVAYLLAALTCNAPTSEAPPPPPAVTETELLTPTFPAPQGLVNDYDSLLTAAQYATLNTRLHDYEAVTDRQIAIVTVADIAPYPAVLDYATALGNAWGVGNAQRNDGVVMVVCRPLSQVAIATGLGAQEALPDSVCTRVLRETLLPRFREGDYFGGMQQGVEELIARWE